MNHILCAGAGNHTFDFNSHHAPRVVISRNGLGKQTIDLVGRAARNRCPSLERVGSTNLYFGTESFLLLNDGFGHMLCKELDSRPRTVTDFLHNLVQRIAKTRHVHTCLDRIEIGVEVKRRIKPLLLSLLISDENGLSDANNTRTTKTYVHSRLAILNVSVEHDTQTRCQFMHTFL